MKKKLSNDEAEKEFYYQIGRLIRKWQYVESLLWRFVSEILGVDQFRARIVFAVLQSTRVRLELIKKLGETYIDPPLLPRFRKLIKRVNDIDLQRNLYAHVSIGTESEPSRSLFMKDAFPVESDGTLHFEWHKFDNSQIKAVADDLEKLRSDLMIFFSDLKGKIHKAAKSHRDAPNKSLRNSD